MTDLPTVSTGELNEILAWSEWTEIVRLDHATVSSIFTELIALRAEVERLREAQFEKVIEIVKNVANFGDLRRDELTVFFGQPRFDLMHDILATLYDARAALTPSQEGRE